MKLGRRTVEFLLLALIFLNILVRVPSTGHETGVDSFFIHNLATAISDQGRIPWVLNLLGYFGWYPLSYPSAAPVLISGVALATDTTEEGSILILSFAYGIIGVLASFVMARAFRRDDLFAITVAVVFSLAPRFMSFTVWSASSRNLFMVLIPIWLWALVRSYRRPSPANFTILASVLIVMLATHRLTILLAVVVFAFIVASVFVLLHRVVRLRFPRALLSASIRRLAPLIAFLGIAAIALLMVFGTEILREYSQGEVCSGENLQAQLCNLGVSVTRSVGLALPFGLVGFFFLVRERNKGFLEAFLVFALLALTPTLFLRQYTGFYILPFISIFAGFGLIGVLSTLSNHRRARNALGIACLVAISAFSMGVLQVEIARSTSLSDPTYSTALYLQSLPGGNFVANDGLLTVRVESVSGRGGLPVGGAGTTHQSPELLIMGAYTASEVMAREQRIPLTELTIEHDSPFLLAGVDVRSDWQNKILFKEADEVTNQTIRQFNLTYYVENDSLRGAFTAFDNVYRGPPFGHFANSVYNTRYKVFDGNTEDIYLAFPAPSPLP